MGAPFTMTITSGSSSSMRSPMFFSLSASSIGASTTSGAGSEGATARHGSTSGADEDAADAKPDGSIVWRTYSSNARALLSSGRESEAAPSATVVCFAWAAASEAESIQGTLIVGVSAAVREVAGPLDAPRVLSVSVPPPKFPLLPLPPPPPLVLLIPPARKAADGWTSSSSAVRARLYSGGSAPRTSRSASRNGWRQVRSCAFRSSNSFI
mmetsp:Transcript_7580/g.23601  ORF Transcript_7580/g.23601 Transcript_7580/m.23601 type:complete len:211 (+) Transcript_7580:651-1283(+)|eukprot:scaffold147013_cov32-Tisochrysis_lutea.AAC.2